MTARASVVAGIVAAALLGAGLLGGGGDAGAANGGGSAASARARAWAFGSARWEGTARLRRAAAAAEEEAAWARGNSGIPDGEIPVEAEGITGEACLGARAPGDAESEPPHDHRQGDVLVPEAIPDDGFEGASEEVPPPPPSPADWLVRHQAEDGSWDGAGLSARCTDDGCSDTVEPGHAVGDTGLALLMFLGYGETHKTPRYGPNVRLGLKHLKWVQDVEGCIGIRTAPGWLEDHALATLAMAEAYGVTQSPLFKAAAQNSVDFLQSCRDPYLAWRHGVMPGPRDAGTTAWSLLALKSAKGAGLEVAIESFEGAMRWFEDRTDPVTGRVWTEDAVDGDPGAATAMGMVVRYFAGAPRDDGLLRAGRDSLLGSLPEAPGERGTVDPLLDYFGSMILFHLAGNAWKQWVPSVIEPVRSRFLGRERGCAAGSLDPPGEGPGAELGRLRTTVLETLPLGLRNCYQRVYADEE